MSVIPFPSKAAKVTTDEYFGGCPVCGMNDGYINHGADHWCCCDVHGVRWQVGSNLFSSWRDEQSQEEIVATAKVMSYRIVEPLQMEHEPPPPRLSNEEQTASLLELWREMAATGEIQPTEIKYPDGHGWSFVDGEWVPY